MNLELDLKVKENPYWQFSRPPFENNTIYNMYDSHEYDAMNNFSLQSIEDLLSEIDFNEFVRYTTMGEVIKFNSKLEYIKGNFGRYFDDYELEVTKAYNWKRGLYDALKHWYTLNADFHKRNSGVSSFFKRIDYNRWHYNKFRDEFISLDLQRMAAKKSVGQVVDNLEELIERNQEQIIKINEETEKANNFSPLYTISNHIRCRNINSEADYTKLKLITIVIAKAKTISVIDNNNNVLYKLPVPKSYLYFERPFYQALNYNYRNRSDIRTFASSPGGKHPYIQTYGSYPYYQRGITSRRSESRLIDMGVGTWSTLCLSNFADDILNALNKNNYLSFVHSISSWNGIYNKDYTTPYNSPMTSFYISGIPNNDDAQSVRRLSGFKTGDCFHDNLRRRQSVESDNHIRETYNFRIDLNVFLYGDDVVQECDAKKCPFRENCNGYKSLTEIDDDYYFRMESLVGAMEERHLNAVNNNLAPMIGRITRRYYDTVSTLMRWEHDVDDLIVQYLEDIQYWGKPKPLTAEERANLWMTSNSQHPSSQSTNQ